MSFVQSCPNDGSTDCVSPNPGRHPSTDSIRTYLLEIGRHPLLTREQEISYAQQVQQMMSLLEAKKVLSRRLRRTPTLDEWAADVQISLASLTPSLRRGERAKRKLVESNLRLVVAIAKKYQYRGMELLDLIQEGSIGLQRGVEKFDPTRGYKFSTYAYWWIRQAITRALAQQSHMIRLPIHITEKINKIKKAQRELSQKLGRVPTVGEVACVLRMTEIQVREHLQYTQVPVSLNSCVGGEEDTELGDFLEDAGKTPQEDVLQLESVLKVVSLLTKLKPQHRQILEMRFGLLGDEFSLGQVARQLSLSRERVRQIELKALKSLRTQCSQLEQGGWELVWSDQENALSGENTDESQLGQNCLPEEQQLSLFELEGFLDKTETLRRRLSRATGGTSEYCQLCLLDLGASATV